MWKHDSYESDIDDLMQELFVAAENYRPPCILTLQLSELMCSTVQMIPFKYQGCGPYMTAMHAFQSCKFPEDERAPFFTCSLGEANGLGRCADLDKIGGLGKWEENKRELMKDILREQIRTNIRMHDLLLATGRLRLVEDGLQDNYWGGTHGSNMVGKIFHELRDEFRRSGGNTAMNGPECTMDLLQKHKSANQETLKLCGFDVLRPTPAQAVLASSAAGSSSRASSSRPPRIRKRDHVVAKGQVAKRPRPAFDPQQQSQAFEEEDDEEDEEDEDEE